MGRFRDLTGMTFNRLTAIKRVDVPKGKSEKVYWLCKCIEGNETVVDSSSLIGGGTKSCGCLKIEKVRENGKNNRKTNTYKLFENYVVGYTPKGEEFYFDLEYFDIVNKYYWNTTKRGYVSSSTFGEQVFLHRLILELDGYEFVSDHINRNKLDNRKENLRICLQNDNVKNQSIRSDNKTGVIGICYSEKRNLYIASIQCDKNKIITKSFENINEAIIFRLNLEKEYFGEFAPQKHLFEQYGIE